MVSGHATNIGVLGRLLGPPDLVVHDALAPFQITDASGTDIFEGVLHDRVIRKPDGTHVFARRFRDSLVDVPAAVVSALVTNWASGCLAKALTQRSKRFSHTIGLSTGCAVTINGSVAFFIVTYSYSVGRMSCGPKPACSRIPTTLSNS